MTIIYLLIFLLPIVLEFNEDICTDGFIRKVALCFLSIGGLLALVDRGTDVICIAAAAIAIEKIIYAQVQEFLVSIGFKQCKKSKTQ